MLTTWLVSLIDNSLQHPGYNVVTCHLSEGSHFSGVRTCGGLFRQYCCVPPLQGLLFSVAWGHVESLDRWSSQNANEASNLSDLVTQDLNVTLLSIVPLFTHCLLGHSSLPFLITSCPHDTLLGYRCGWVVAIYRVTVPTFMPVIPQLSQRASDRWGLLLFGWGADHTFSTHDATIAGAQNGNCNREKSTLSQIEWSFIIAIIN